MKFTIPLPPRTKKNSNQIVRNSYTGKPSIIPSKVYREYEKYALWLVPRLSKPIDYPINLKCIFYMPNKRRVDKVNLEEAIQDVLVKAGVLADDNRNIVATTDGSMVLLDRENPRTEVEITPLENYIQW